MIFSRDGSGWMSVLRGGRFDVSLMSVIYSAVSLPEKSAA